MYLLGLSKDKKKPLVSGMAAGVYRHFRDYDFDPRLFSDLNESSYYSRIAHFPGYLPAE
ncbi:hypothetical protein GKZ89_18710 [Bacillus mangrovi]|uniref:Uncharacterized protein n=1 Tax=Metabacillus mangrovi TaxID=1491830 RepID=A0A7X2S863_9BACI|nr:hypothetical protein [Metabacillus mangrovi]MTH55427.1 hypothetical protein [Metabacillus mangrovi]